MEINRDKLIHPKGNTIITHNKKGKRNRFGVSLKRMFVAGWKFAKLKG